MVKNIYLHKVVILAQGNILNNLYLCKLLNNIFILILNDDLK